MTTSATVDPVARSKDRTILRYGGLPSDPGPVLADMGKG